MGRYMGGKLEARRLAETLGDAPAAVQYVGPNCTSTTLGVDGGVPSKSPWVDRVQVAFAEALGRGQRTRPATAGARFQAEKHPKWQ